MTGALSVRSLRAWVFRCPITPAVVTSFGAMHDRPMVLVRVEDDDGVAGWGEVWCNFPAVGAEHRARLLETVLFPLLKGKTFASPREAFGFLCERTAVLALQSGEHGPIAQCIAGIDIALWDLGARRAGQPLWRLLGGTSPQVRVYASGLNPDGPEKLAAARYAEGHRAFKLKVGFGAERDLSNLQALRKTLGDDVALMVDANQAWQLEQARLIAPQLLAFNLEWLEEPLRADRPWSEWHALSQAGRLALAAGENLAGESQFEVAIGSGALAVVQPDIAKWGGFSGCLPIARRIIGAGLRFCPHYLGGGVGLLATAQILAAAGGDGMLEIDSNPNPLRTLTCGTLDRVHQGQASLGEAPGLGVEPDMAALERYAVHLS